MPDGLDTVLFVNSGSEANDLAWRLATTVTGADAGIATAWSYHGVTAAIADFSPPSGPAASNPLGVEAYPAPDTYRGRYADASDPGLGGASRDHRRPWRAWPSAGGGRRRSSSTRPSPPTASSCRARESWPRSSAAARDAGALFVADEVQSGHGRTGELWGFTRWGVTPDIVTLGKPMGNGHPIAAVITRAEIVDRFGAQTTFFSTFGGNPVACAAALAVLDVLEDERLIDERGDRRRLAALSSSRALAESPRRDRRRARSGADDRASSSFAIARRGSPRATSRPA